MGFGWITKLSEGDLQSIRISPVIAMKMLSYWKSANIRIRKITSISKEGDKFYGSLVSLVTTAQVRLGLKNSLFRFRVEINIHSELFYSFRLLIGF